MCKARTTQVKIGDLKRARVHIFLLYKARNGHWITHWLTYINYGALPDNLIQMKALILKFVEYCNVQNWTFFNRFYRYYFWRYFSSGLFGIYFGLYRLSNSLHFRLLVGSNLYHNFDTYSLISCRPLTKWMPTWVLRQKRTSLCCFCYRG